jgi:putative membrane protein
LSPTATSRDLPAPTIHPSPSGDLFEIQSSQLALTRAASPDVRAYAQQLIADHTAASQRLKALASGLPVPLPTAPEGPHAALLTQLGTLQGAAFDQAYMAAQLTAHEQAVNLFTAYSRAGHQPQLRAHAVQTLPHLRMHLERARTLQGMVTHNQGRHGARPPGEDRAPFIRDPVSQGRQAELKRKQASSGTP